MPKDPKSDRDSPYRGDPLGRQAYRGGWWARVVGYSVLLGFGTTFSLDTFSDSSLGFAIGVSVGVSALTLIYFVVMKGRSRIW